MRAKAPKVKLVAVQPASSPMLTTGVPGPNKIQGIGPNFVPSILERSSFDVVEDVEYEAAIAMQRRLTREEGLLSGISTGAIVAAAAKVAAELGPGKNVVAILCDTGERYLTHELVRGGVRARRVRPCNDHLTPRSPSLIPSVCVRLKQYYKQLFKERRAPIGSGVSPREGARALRAPFALV